MYLPAAFSADSEVAQAVVKAHPFASFVTVHDGAVFLTQIPLLQINDTTLIAHMARANPHSAALLAAKQPIAATLQFTGPNCYVSPAWYEKNTGVPTWNYATVQALGSVHLLEGAPATEAVVKQLIEQFDSQADLVKQAWADSPATAQAAQLGAILAFEIRLTSLQAKTKLSQNRPAADQARVRAELAVGTVQAQAVAALMQPS
jgi:transcriptional regulator